MCAHYADVSPRGEIKMAAAKKKKVTTGDAFLDEHIIVASSGPITSVPIFREVPVSEIRTGLNIRSVIDETELDSLLSSIKVNGILEPLLVGASSTQDGYDLISGERRLQCAKTLSMERVPCMVYRDISQSQLYEIMLSENLLRSDLNPMEEAFGLKKMIEVGMSQTELAERIGKTQAFVSYRLQLLEIPEILQRQIITRVITPTHVRELSKFSNAPLANDFYQFYEDYQKKRQSEKEEGPDYTITVNGIEKIIPKFFSHYAESVKRKEVQNYWSFDVGSILSNKDCPQNKKCSKCDHRYDDYCFDVDCVLKTRSQYCVWGDEQRKKADGSEIPVMEFRNGSYYKREFPLKSSDCGSCSDLEERKRSYSDEMYFVCKNPDCYNKKNNELVELLLSQEKEVVININDILMGSKKTDCVPDVISFLFGKHLNEIAGVYKQVYGVKMDTKKDFSHVQKVAFLQLFFLNSMVPSVGETGYLNRNDFVRFSEEVHSLGYNQGD